jgi:hypothetical protein
MRGRKDGTITGPAVDGLLARILAAPARSFRHARISCSDIWPTSDIGPVLERYERAAFDNRSADIILRIVVAAPSSYLVLGAFTCIDLSQPLGKWAPDRIEWVYGRRRARRQTVLSLARRRRRVTGPVLGSGGGLRAHYMPAEALAKTLKLVAICETK